MKEWLENNKHLKLNNGFYVNPFPEGTYQITLIELNQLYKKFHNNHEKDTRRNKGRGQ